MPTLTKVIAQLQHERDEQLLTVQEHELTKEMPEYEAEYRRALIMQRYQYRVSAAVKRHSAMLKANS